MSSADAKRLLVGLGNPGVRYEKTRHNYGFMVVEAFVRKQGWSLKRGWRVSGKVAVGVVGGCKVHVLLPHTYMNLSGEAVARMMRLYGIAAKDVMVVVDDVALLFGMMRERSQGSSGGHNGLASLEAHLRTREYARLRMGIDNAQRAQLPLEAFVLNRFDEDEEAKLPELIAEGVTLLEEWLHRSR